MTERPRVFISYSHDSEAHRDRVLALSERLRKEGVETVLDRYVNGAPPETWPRWMLDGLDQSTHVVCICSETYYRRFRGHEVPGRGKGVDWEGAIITQELYDARSRNTRFIPVLLDAGEYGHIPEPLRGVTHYRWPDEYQALYDALLGQAGVEPGPLGELRRKPRPAGAVTTDPSPRSPGSGGDPAGATAKADTEPTREELEALFSRLVEAMDEALGAAHKAAEFLGPKAPAGSRLAVLRDGNWEVAPVYRRGGADVCPVLESAARRLAGFSAARQEWDALEQVLGGLFALGINPRWVWRQRHLLAKQALTYPRLADVVPLGNRERARLLPALANALAQGCVRLERVFGTSDSRLVPDFPAVLPGITEADRALEMKRHFVRFVLGPSADPDVEWMSGEELAVAFRRIGELLTYAARAERDPFVAAGPRFAQLAAEVKQHLELSDLYLFVPSGSGAEFELLTHPVIALKHLQSIHTTIQQRRPAN